MISKKIQSYVLTVNLKQVSGENHIYIDQVIADICHPLQDLGPVLTVSLLN